MTPGRSRTRLALGALLLLAAPLVGVLPGPGGILCAAAGLSLMLRHSPAAKRRYVRLKARFPKAGRACDRALRRPRRNRPPR